MTIAAIIASATRAPVTVTPDASVAQVVALLAAERIGAVPVVDADGRPVGILSERDLGRLVADGGADCADALHAVVGEVMTSPAVTVTPATPVLQALAQMTRRRIRHLPVMDGDAMVGVVSIGDLVKFRIDRIEAEAAAMRQYITQG